LKRQRLEQRVHQFLFPMEYYCRLLISKEKNLVCALGLVFIPSRKAPKTTTRTACCYRVCAIAKCQSTQIERQQGTTEFCWWAHMCSTLYKLAAFVIENSTYNYNQLVFRISQYNTYSHNTRGLTPMNTHTQTFTPMSISKGLST
jgi:hypothetical protein